MNLIEKTKSLRESATHNLETLDKIKNDTKFDIMSLIVECVGLNTPMTFNDETGYPKFDDDIEDILSSVVGIRVKGDAETMTNFELEFNTNCGDDEYGLDADTWFIPDYYGSYDLTDLFENICSWIEQHN